MESKRCDPTKSEHIWQHSNETRHSIKSKHIQRRSNEHLQVACASMHGPRKKMQDVHTIQLDFCSFIHPNASFVGVYDGHNGSEAAVFCDQVFPIHVARQSKLSSLSELIDTFHAIDYIYYKDYAPAAAFSFENFDEKENAKQQQLKESGCSVVIAAIEPITGLSETTSKKWSVTIAHTGDSRAILINANDGSVQPLTTDHDLRNIKETKRVHSAKGFSFEGRIDNDLGVTRSIGDYRFKCDPKLSFAEQKVISTPEVLTTIVDPNHFLLLATQEIFRRMPNNSIGKLIVDAYKKQTSDAKDLGIIVSELLGTHCCSHLHYTQVILYFLLFSSFFFLCLRKTGRLRKVAKTIRQPF